MTPWHHAESSVATFGGEAADYFALHAWFDDTKAYFPDFRHRALRHHSAGIIEAETVFGPRILNSAGRAVPVRLLGEQHVKEDCGFIPTVADWLSRISVQPWMRSVSKKSTRGSVVISPEDGDLAEEVPHESTT